MTYTITFSLLLLWMMISFPVSPLLKESRVKTRSTYRKSPFNMPKRGLKSTYDAGVLKGQRSQCDFVPRYATEPRKRRKLAEFVEISRVIELVTVGGEVDIFRQGRDFHSSSDLDRAVRVS